MMSEVPDVNYKALIGVGNVVYYLLANMLVKIVSDM